MLEMLEKSTQIYPERQKDGDREKIVQISNQHTNRDTYLML